MSGGNHELPTTMVQLGKVHSRIVAELSHLKTEAILLSSDQMLVSRSMVTNPAPSSFKTPSLVPAPDGYAIYVQVRSQVADQGHPPQRFSSQVSPVPWSAARGMLRLDRTNLDQRWELLTPGGEIVSFTAYCGSEQVFDEVDSVLTILSGILLG